MGDKVNIVSICQMNQQDHGRGLIKYLMKFGAIASEGTIVCEKCEKPLVLDKKDANNFRWRCYRRVNGKHCRYSVSIRNDTFFEGSHLTITQICIFINLWLDNVSYDCIKKQASIVSQETIVNWSMFCREVLHNSMIVNKIRLGGPGKIVEIDESKFGRRKYNRGRIVEGQWVFGGIERESKHCFMVPVEKRNRETLIPLITEWIVPGTTIISDCWRAYNCLQELGYTHLSVNHSVEFVNEQTGAHTNTIESLWFAAKRSFSNSSRRKYFYGGYLSKFMFEHMCRVNGLDPFTEFLKAAANLYDPHEKYKTGTDWLFRQAELERNDKMRINSGYVSSENEDEDLE